MKNTALKPDTFMSEAYLREIKKTLPQTRHVTCINYQFKPGESWTTVFAMAEKDGREIYNWGSFKNETSPEMVAANIAEDIELVENILEGRSNDYSVVANQILGKWILKNGYKNDLPLKEARELTEKMIDEGVQAKDALEKLKSENLIPVEAQR